MNALAHAMEALYTPLANPVSSMAALRGGGAAATDDRESLALGAVLAGYASGSTGIAVHHAICQTLVREAGTPARRDQRGDAAALGAADGGAGAGGAAGVSTEALPDGSGVRWPPGVGTRG